MLKSQNCLFQVGKENAELALSLVGYDEELKVCFYMTHKLVKNDFLVVCAGICDVLLSFSLFEFCYHVRLCLLTNDRCFEVINFSVALYFG